MDPASVPNGALLRDSVETSNAATVAMINMVLRHVDDPRTRTELVEWRERLTNGR